MIRRVRLPLALACAAAAIVLTLGSAPAQSGSGSGQGRGAPQPPAADPGMSLFEEECSSCHGFDARGVADRGPSLRGAGEAAADFYLRTGRMPLSAPGEQPGRAEPAYDSDQIDALVSYIGSFGGPAIPEVDTSKGSVSDGQALFTSSCSGCHAITGEGGVVVGAEAPSLKDATPTQVAEAIRVGPFVMPAFGRDQLSDADVNSIARYVSEVIDDPDDSGGWGIGHIGPVPEGMIAWLLAAVALVLVAWLIGEGRERS